MLIAWAIPLAVMTIASLLWALVPVQHKGNCQPSGLPDQCLPAGQQSRFARLRSPVGPCNCDVSCRHITPLSHDLQEHQLHMQKPGVAIPGWGRLMMVASVVRFGLSEGTALCTLRPPRSTVLKMPCLVFGSFSYIPRGDPACRRAAVDTRHRQTGKSAPALVICGHCRHCMNAGMAAARGAQNALLPAKAQALQQQWPYHWQSRTPRPAAAPAAQCLELQV